MPQLKDMLIEVQAKKIEVADQILALVSASSPDFVQINMLQKQGFVDLPILLYYQKC